MLYSQDETSEEFMGEWVEKRGILDPLVIATMVRLGSFIPSMRQGLKPSLHGTQQTSLTCPIGPSTPANYPMMRLDYGILRRQAPTVHPDSGSNPDYVTDRLPILLSFVNAGLPGFPLSSSLQ